VKKASKKVDVVTGRLGREEGVLVTVTDAKGSVPREPGAWMAVFSDSVAGTIGGGHLEFQAIDEARKQLAAGAARTSVRFALGPSLGQCCGGVVELGFERIGAADVPSLERRLAPKPAPLALFGGGHVGEAIVDALSPLPFDVRWIDSRDGIFPDPPPSHAVCEHSDPVQAAVADLAAGSRVLIMSFSHAEDLDIVAACLKRLRERGDLPYVGLIGSKTKWAVFRHRLEARGFAEDELARITCPIGIPGITGKEPEVIAASVVAQILQVAPPSSGRDR
jgi:xanthine dehydrogenase accessory factor